MKNVKMGLIGTFLILLAVCVGNASAAWLTGYNSSTAIVLNTNGQTLENQQVNIILQGNDVTAPNFVNFSKTNSTDLRFTGSDRVTLLPFWVESWNTTAKTASVWVKTSASSTSVPEFYRFSVSNTRHNDYGIQYPVTYVFSIPAGSADLSAYVAYSSNGTWSQLTEKTSSDLFNGIDAVRFDYTNNTAYVSAAFSATSNDLYIGVFNSDDEQVGTYQRVSKYYDNRDCAVVATIDDCVGLDQNLTNIVDLFQAKHIWLTTAITTNNGGYFMNASGWADLQTKMNNGYLEPASHSRTHVATPYADPDGEIGGSKAEIIANLSFPALNKKGTTEYMYAWVAPGGAGDNTNRQKLGEYKYLCDRLVTTNRNYLTTWDYTNNVYYRSGVTLETDENSLVSYAPVFPGTNSWNSSFDNVLASKGVYTLYMHAVGVNTTNLGTHLDYLKDRNNVWYVGYGHLYLYTYTREFASQAVPTTGSGIYVYYGNSSVSSVSSFDNTFTKNSSVSGLTGAWLFDSTGSVAVDSSSSNNNGTVVGATRTGSDLPCFAGNGNVVFSSGNSLNFNGSSGNYVDMGNNANTQFTTAFTLSATVKYLGNSSLTSCTVMDKGKEEWSAPYNGYHLGYSASANRWEFKVADADTSYDIVTFSHVYADVYNTTHDVFATFDNGHMILYVDGLPVASKTSTTVTNVNATQSNFKVGVYSTGSGSQYWNGTIDNVRVYNKVLSEDEIKAIRYCKKYTSYDVSTISQGVWTPADNGVLYKNVVNTITANDVKYSTPDVDGNEIITNGVFSTSGTVDVLITEWAYSGDYRKVWTESSEDHDTEVTHVMSGFPANRDVFIYCDGDAYEQIRADSNGVIAWVYNGGFSEHEFEAIVTSEWDTTRNHNSDVTTWVTVLGLIGVIVLIHFVSRLIKMMQGLGGDSDEGVSQMSALVPDLVILAAIVVLIGVLTYIFDSINI